MYKFILCLAIFCLPFLTSSAKGKPANKASLSHDTTVTWNPDGTGQGYNSSDTSSVYFEQVVDNTSNNCSINHDISKNTWYFVDFSPGNNQWYNRYMLCGNNKLYYQLYHYPYKSGILMKAQVASEYNVLQHEINQKDSPGFFPLTYYWTINSGQSVPPGTYTDTVTLRLYKDQLTKNYKLQDTVQVTYRTVVSQSMQTSVTGDYDDYDEINQLYTIDFGQGSAGDNKNLSFNVLSNGGYNIKVKSQNRGYLHNQTNFKNRSEYKVEYTFLFNNSSVNLKQSGYRTVMTKTATQNPQTDSYPIVITLGSLEDKFSGTYADVIEIVAQAID
jgi:spore coat protein U-like protein